MFIGWSIDIAREQSPSRAWLESTMARSREAGYNAVGLYLEHRFAYRSAPWAAADGCLTPETARQVVEACGERGPRVIPFVNTLGHMEGFIRSEGGQWLSEGPARGSLQICPSRSECVEFARGLVADALEVFDDEWVHLGGDETKQLGQCPQCAEREKTIGKAGIYAAHFGPLCRWVLKRGRRPCLWGDMLLQHREALDAIPRETVIFDWQYESGPAESTRVFRERGFDVVCCPSIQTYNSGWCFLDASKENVDLHAEAAEACGALGVLVTTWEQCFFSHYGSILPLVMAAGRRLSSDTAWKSAIEASGGRAYAGAAEILGNEVPAMSAFLAPGTWRQLRDRFAMRLNPFELWRDWRGEACGRIGDEIDRLCRKARVMLPDDSELQWPIALHRVAVAWVRGVELAYRAYAKREIASAATRVGELTSVLNPLLPELERIARAGGSSADVARLDALVESTRVVAGRIRALSPDSPHLPSFEALIGDAFVSGDQAGLQA